MPLFNRNKATSAVPAEIIDIANTAVEHLQQRKVAEFVLPEPGTGLRVPNLVRCYLQAHVRRCLMFIEAGAAELDANRPLAAELCTRAIYENIAAVCSFTDKLKPLCEAVDYAGVETLVSKAAFATRIPSFVEKFGEDVQAPQILNQIDKMRRRYPAFRSAYDHLSDIVHPNGLGAVIYFGTFVTGSRVCFDDGGTSKSAERAHASLVIAATLLLHVELALIQADQRLQKLSSDVITKRG